MIQAHPYKNNSYPDASLLAAIRYATSSACAKQKLTTPDEAHLENYQVKLREYLS
ncbi:hypothetical protein D3C80_1806770 [compost metagenome]